MSEIRVENIIGETGVDAVKFTKGINVTGVTTATSFSGSGASLTSLPAGNLTGALPAISGANLTGISAGITMVDQWNIRNDNNKTNGQVIDSNWERSDFFFAQIGTGMTQSSGIFTFPQTGIYFIMSQHTMNTSASYCGVQMRMSSDSGSNYSTVSYGQITNTNNGYHHMHLQAVVDVQNELTYRFGLRAYNSGNVQYSGDTNALRNGVTFIRLGDT